ncbi:MAG: hypothetical protein DRO88_09720 [Promethearchaeia archaeon]|nr:MAG: hypothetical protein DRO88_09720 [Candidatus Lokiarchaeia archaeon]
MSEMLTDLLQNIYSRISQLGKVIQNLQVSIDELNQNLVDRVDSLVNSIHSMTESVEREGEAQHLVFEQIGDNVVGEIAKFREKMGLKDLDEVFQRLEQIVETSEEALKPETVDLLLKEVLEGIRGLKEAENGNKGEQSAESLIEQVDKSLSKPVETESSEAADAQIPEPKFSSQPVDNSSQNLQIPSPSSEENKKKLKENPPPGINPPPK